MKFAIEWFVHSNDRLNDRNDRKDNTTVKHFTILSGFLSMFISFEFGLLRIDYMYYESCEQ